MAVITRPSKRSTLPRLCGCAACTMRFRICVSLRATWAAWVIGKVCLNSWWAPTSTWKPASRRAGVRATSGKCLSQGIAPSASSSARIRHRRTRHKSWPTSGHCRFRRTVSIWHCRSTPLVCSAFGTARLAFCRRQAQAARASAHARRNVDADSIHAERVRDREHGAEAAKGIYDGARDGVILDEVAGRLARRRAHGLRTWHETSVGKHVGNRRARWRNHPTAEAEEMRIAGPSDHGGASRRSADDAMKKQIHARVFGSACDQVTLVHPDACVAHVALKEDGHTVVGHACHHGRGGLAKPCAPFVEAKASQLG